MPDDITIDEPMTRIEKFLAAAAGENIQLDEPQTRIEKYEWKYKSAILTHIAFRPLTKCGTSIVIHISEEDWLRHTDGGIEHVITHAAESN